MPMFLSNDAIKRRCELYLDEFINVLGYEVSGDVFKVGKHHLAAIEQMVLSIEESEQHENLLLPCFSEKRPFGNGVPANDLVRILEACGLPASPEAVKRFSAEAALALQICMSRQAFEECSIPVRL